MHEGAEFAGIPRLRGVASGREYDRAMFPTKTSPPAILGAAALLAAGSLLLGCSSADPVAAPQAPAGLDFYTPAADTITGEHGSVIWSRPLSGIPGLANADNHLVLYRSVDPKGETVAVSGVVAVPRGEAPAGGWPLISWAHGTTGIADACAPSRDTDENYPAHAYIARTRVVQQRLLDAGYAVAMTDYQGLGTPGRHSYLIGEAQARAVADMARAARELAPSIGTRWATIGHSQGGQAAIFTNAIGPAWTPELQLVGAAALAPANNNGSRLALLRSAAAVGPAADMTERRAALPFAPLVIAGAETAGGFDPAAFLTPQAVEKLKLVDDNCIPALSTREQWTGIGVHEVVTPTGDLSGIRAVLDANEPTAVRSGLPLLVIQGRRDVIVVPEGTDAMVAQLRAAGTPVDYRTDEYADADHRAILESGLDTLLTWTDNHFDRA